MTHPPRSQPDKTAQSDTARRLSRLVGRAQAADLWERLWRALIPPLVVVGVFLCVSWLGLWFDVPHWGRAVGVTIFAVLLLVSSVGFIRLAPLSRADALRRIDKASGMDHRPASVLEDRLATGGRDPGTDALWALHQRRAAERCAELKAGRPSPRAVDLDRYAIRGGVVVALIACAIVAGPQRYARVAAAFDFGGGDTSGAGYRLDAWLDPPPYTGKPPVLLDLASDKAHDPRHPLAIAAPVGSLVVVRSSGGSAAELDTTGPLLPPPARSKAAATAGADGQAPAKPDGSGDQQDAAAPKAPGDSEARLVLHGDSQLVIRHGGSLRGAFALTAIADQPPTIALREIPKANARGSLTLAYTTGDDYGVASAEAVFSAPKINGVPMAGPALVGAPKMVLSLPGISHGIGDGETTADLSDSPWAGAQVTMVLVARDEGGNEGRSDPVQITLPQKPFENPLARALVEQRRALVLAPSRRADVAVALDALMLDPDAFGTTPGVYLGLRFGADLLARAQTKDQLVAVADYLWGMALQIENGDLSDAERALRNAEKELRDAIERGASEKDIQKLTQTLQAAMDKFLKELAQQDQKSGQPQQAQNGRQAKSVSQNDLQKLIDRLKEQARSGNREEAKKALDELQDILENLKTAKRQKADPQARAMAEGLNQLDQMMRDQQDLRDQTFKQGQGEQNGEQNGEQQGSQQQGQDGQDGQGMGQGMGRQSGNRGQRGGQGQNGQGQNGQGQNGQGQNGQRQGENGRGQRGGKSLGQRQQQLRDRLADIQKKLKQAGQGQGALDDAAREMREAEDALRQGQGANGQAVDAQGRALEALGKGAKKLADAMQQGEGAGGQANSDQDGQQGSAEGQQTSDADPLGRPRGGSRSLDSASRFDPLGVPAAQRAQRVLEELRRRLADPLRNQEEIDYLERLLHSY